MADPQYTWDSKNHQLTWQGQTYQMPTTLGGGNYSFGGQTFTGPQWNDTAQQLALRNYLSMGDEYGPELRAKFLGAERPLTSVEQQLQAAQAAMKAAQATTDGKPVAGTAFGDTDINGFYNGINPAWIQDNGTLKVGNAFADSSQGVQDYNAQVLKNPAMQQAPTMHAMAAAQQPQPLPNVSYINGINAANLQPLNLGGLPVPLPQHSNLSPAQNLGNTGGVSAPHLSGRDATVTALQPNPVFNQPGATWGQFYGAQQNPNQAAQSLSPRMEQMIGSKQIAPALQTPKTSSGKTLGEMLAGLAMVGVPAVAGAVGHLFGGGPSAVANATGGAGGAGGAGGTATSTGNYSQSQQVFPQNGPPTPKPPIPPGSSGSGLFGDNNGFGQPYTPPTGGGSINWYKGNPNGTYNQADLDALLGGGFTPGFTGGVNGDPNYTPYNGGVDMGRQTQSPNYDPTIYPGYFPGYTPMTGMGADQYAPPNYGGANMDTDYYRNSGSLMSPSAPPYSPNYEPYSPVTNYNPQQLDQMLNGNYNYGDYQPAPSGITQPDGLLPFTD